MKHFYIHIPFCDSKCHYCSFNSFAGYKNTTIEKYFSALEKQLLFELERFKVKRGSIDTLYFGGGTPSSVKSKYYSTVFEILKPFLSTRAEITIEANPNSITDKWIREILAFGVNRISIGVQSFYDEKLKLLGRIHSSKTAYNAILLAKEAGFDNISIDIIYDTVFDTIEFVKNEIETALSLPISHISAYSLTIENNSAFEGQYNLKKDNLESCLVIFNAIKEAGFKHYEISNFGKIKSRHNSAYWNGSEYAGVGAGAVGFFKNKRLYPSENIEDYIENPLSIKEEILKIEDMRFERVFMGLRSYIGVNMDDIKPTANIKIRNLVEENKIKIKKGRIINQDFLLADEIALYLET